MTQAQKDAQEKIYQLIHEHFDAGLIVVQVTEDASDTPGTISGFACSFHGGWINAIGLAETAKYYIQHDFDDTKGKDF